MRVIRVLMRVGGRSIITTDMSMSHNVTLACNAPTYIADVMPLACKLQVHVLLHVYQRLRAIYLIFKRICTHESAFL